MFRAGLIFLDTGSPKMLVALAKLLAGVQGLSPEAVLRVEEGGSLHDAAHHVVVARFEQVEEGVGDVFADALGIFGAGLVRGRKHSAAGLWHSVAVGLVLLLCSAVEDSAAVDANGGELGVLSQDVGVVVGRGIRSARYDALRSATGLHGPVVSLDGILARPYHVRDDDGTLPLLTVWPILQG